MLKVSRLCDYASMIMVTMSRHDATVSAQSLARSSTLPHATVQLVLKRLARARLVVSRQGANGGYRLARPPQNITVQEIIEAIDGPLALVECLDDKTCRHRPNCASASSWGLINQKIKIVLQHTSLFDMKSAAETTIPHRALYNWPAPPSPN